MYTIRIDRTEMVEKECGRRWEQVRTEEEAKNCEDGVYGYTPPIVKPVEVDTKVLEQTVDDLDLNAVIKAINKL